MDLGLQDRVYLVTGGSRGLGFAAAQALVADGARVLLTATHETTAAAAVTRLTQDAAPGAVAGAVVESPPSELLPGQHRRDHRVRPVAARTARSAGLSLQQGETRK